MKSKVWLCCTVVGGILSCMAWDADTPQPNRFELPPASPEVVKEARLAKARIKTVLPSMILAHRGESEYCPENTVPAFAASVARGVGFECDLWLSNDGVIFITHDAKINPWKVHRVEGWATNMTWRGSLDGCDVGRWKGRPWRGTRMPTIDDVLPWAGEGYHIELHVCDLRIERILPRLKEAFTRHPNATSNNVRIATSMDGRRWMRKNMPGFPCSNALLLRKGWRVTDTPIDVRAEVDRIGPGLNVEVWGPRWDEDLLTKEIVDLVHRKGLKICVWTVNDAASAWAALGRGVDMLITDRPSSLLREMAEF